MRLAWLEVALAVSLAACGSTQVLPDAGPADASFVPPKKEAGVDASGYVAKGKRCERDDDAAAPPRWMAPGSDAGSSDAMDEEASMPPGDPLALPQVVTTKGTVADKPVIIPITYDGDELRDEIEDFTASMGCTGWWHATATDYGIADAISGTPVHLAEAPPTEITDQKIRTWLTQKIIAKTVPPPNGPNLLYAIFYPADTIVDAIGGKSCFAFGAYHSAYGYLGNNIPYAVMPRCGGIEQLTAVTSHEFIEYATDPIVGGFTGTTDEFAAWGLGYQEVGDMCEYATSANFLPSDYPFYVQRSWSNKAAFFGDNPCVPGDSAVWYAGVPIMNDWVTVQGSKLARGVKLPIGQMTTIDVQMIAKGATGSWSVDAQDLTLWQTGKAGLKFAWNKAQGSAGETLHLTISRVGTSPSFGAAPFWIASSQSNDQHLWFGIVGD
jgi:hypothetical protein